MFKQQNQPIKRCQHVHRTVHNWLLIHRTAGDVHHLSLWQES